MKVDGDFTRLEAVLARITGALSTRERKTLATKIGQSLRRSNSARIARNVQPDGSAMEARKQRAPGGKKGRMFQRLRMIRVLKSRPSAEGVEISFAGNAETVAEIHHFGRVGSVGRSRDGRVIRTRYAARQLLGEGADDEEEALSAIEAHLGKL